MSFFVESTPAAKPKTKNVRPVSLGLATALVVMVVAQLFTFEMFSTVISGMRLPGGHVMTSVYAALIVSLEVAALPFLLGMRLSPAMRIMSMVAGWMAVVGWFIASLWSNLLGGKLTN